ncbi:MAG: sensor histidine kinase [Verrucomicrobiota bacterium]
MNPTLPPENTGVVLVVSRDTLPPTVIMLRSLSIILCGGVFLPSIVSAESAEALRAKAVALEEELEALPRPLAGPAGGTLGYASEVTTKEIGKAMPKWVEVELEAPVLIDAIALVPGWRIGPDRSERTHGFPTDFVVEIITPGADAKSELDRITVFESGPDFPDPGRHPLWIDVEPVEAQTVRVTAEVLGANFLGFSEILIFAGGRNVALGAQVNARDTLLENENWRNEFLTDGYTPLGLPIRSFSQRRNGFRTSALRTNRIPVTVELEWEKEAMISSVKLVPTLIIPNLMAIGRWGQGFPAAFQIEVSSGDGIGPWTSVFSYPADEGRPFPNPGNVGWQHDFPEIAANRLRIVATRHRFDPVVQAIYFSLAEIQVFDGDGTNVALGSRVRTSHPATKSDQWSGGAWARETLVDGYSGDGELAPMREWLQQLDRRRQILGELETLDAAILVAESRERERQRWLLILSVIPLIGLVGMFFVRIKRLRNQEANRLRERIANDLHDEVGSTLGSIALNAEVLSRRPDTDKASERLQQMAARAREASQTMRDLVWVVDHRTDDSLNLLERLRSSAAELLGETSYRFEVPEPFPRVALSPEQKRHLLLFLKEALHNVLRHAEAEEILIRFDLDQSKWRLSVEDDGRGFEFDEGDQEQLDRLRSRARKLDGRLDVVSELGKGTRIEILAPLKGGLHS